MKNLISFTVIILFLFSCKKPTSDGFTVHKRIYLNQSNHKIKIKNYYNFDLNLMPNEEYLWQRGNDGFSYPRNTGYVALVDSAEVIYDDTLTVFHGSKNYTMFRDLRRFDMFDFDEKTEGNVLTYTYTYTFTNADFEEAKTK